MLMAHSVEGRFPFLDPDVARLADSLPPSYKLRVLDEKHVLKQVAKGLVPAEILERKKQPYRAPDARVVRRPRGARVGDGRPLAVGAARRRCLRSGRRRTGLSQVLPASR